MQLIPNLTAEPAQKQTIVLPDGTKVTMRIQFRANQYGWYFDELSWSTFTLRGLRISNSPNMLHQWRNGIPFGIACFTAGNREPTQQQDFSSGAAKLYVLSQAEVEEYTTILRGD